MASYHAHAFVDGGYLRSRGRDAGIPFPDPVGLVNQVVNSIDVQGWARPMYESRNHIALTRTIYYDAAPDNNEAADAEMRRYWEAVENAFDTSLGFGYLRGRAGKEPRQKAVDTLLTVDMLVGAFTKLFSVAILVAGDADFVPAVDETRRRGVHVIVVADSKTLSGELRRAADRVLWIGSGQGTVKLHPFSF